MRRDQSGTDDRRKSTQAEACPKFACLFPERSSQIDAAAACGRRDPSYKILGVSSSCAPGYSRENWLAQQAQQNAMKEEHKTPHKTSHGRTLLAKSVCRHARVHHATRSWAGRRIRPFSPFAIILWNSFEREIPYKGKSLMKENPL